MFRKNAKEKSKNKNDIKLDNLKILSIRRYDEEKGCFELKDGSLLDLLELVPRDRENIHDDEVRYDMYTMTRFYRLFSPDIKIISLNFPISTVKQQEVLKRAIKNTSNQVRIKWLEREIEELELLDENVQRREFYLMYFAEDEATFDKNRNDLLTLLGTGRKKIVTEMDKYKKVQVIRKLNNMNMLIVPGEFEESEEADE